MAGERPKFTHHQPHPEQKETSRRSSEPVGTPVDEYRRSEAEYRRFHESFVRSLERTHTSIRNLPRTEDRDLDDMTEQEIDEAMSQIEKEAELFHSQKKSRQ
jgi:hypothetical protein